MLNIHFNSCFISLFLVLIYVASSYGQFYNHYQPAPPKKIAKWCVVGKLEYIKCTEFVKALWADVTEFGDTFMEVKCINGTSKYDCMRIIEDEKADLTSMDAGELFRAGRYFSSVPIVQEIYTGGLKHYFAVAVVKKGTLQDVTHIRHLKGKKACFAEVESFAGWILPLVELMKSGSLETVDCNNQVRNAANFFGPSCAVNSLLDKYNPIGDNSDKLCKLCYDTEPGIKCTSADRHAGFTGAFKCLQSVGEIAFLKHTTIFDLALTSNITYPVVDKNDFELLCVDGSRKPVDDYINCNWGSVPSHAIVTSSAKDSKTRRVFQHFLKRASELYGPMAGEKRNRYNYTAGDHQNQYDRFGNRESQYPNDNGYDRDRDQYGREQYGRDNNYNDYNSYSSTTEITVTDHKDFRLFESIKYGFIKHDLMFSDNTEELTPIQEGEQTFKDYLGRNYDAIVQLRKCPVKSVTLCVTSDPELLKCHKMRIALKAQLLEPEMICYKGHSHIHCMQAIRNGDADISVLDAGDVYTAGLHYKLVPIMAEVYNLGVPEYFAVAVSKEEDPETEITYLRGKNTCHSGINTGAGWVVPMAYLLSNGWIRGYGCDAMRAASEYFSKMCLPGSQSTEYNTGVPYDNMCHLCHGASYRYCHRDASEDYYGHTGAFRCLVEGGGHVAFVKHTTVLENTDGKRREWWARNTLNEDFELLCPDGTRSTLDDYEKCNLGRVKANAIVTRGGDDYNIVQINAYINLFVYAQQFYGRKDQDDFNFAMFYSQPPYSDLIFQDATTQLQIVPPALRWYSDYLGKDFMRAKRIVDCYAGGSHILASFSVVFIAFILVIL